MLAKCIICGNEFEAKEANENICPDCKAAAAGKKETTVPVTTPPVYKNTQLFIETLKAKGWNYRLNAHTEEGKSDRVVIPMSAENLPSIPVCCFFNPDEERVAVYVYNVHKFTENKLHIVPELIYTLQSQYMFARWNFDKSDNTLQAEWFGHVAGGADIGNIVLTSVKRITGVVDECFPLIMQTVYTAPPKMDTVKRGAPQNGGSMMS